MINNRPRPKSQNLISTTNLKTENQKIRYPQKTEFFQSCNEVHAKLKFEGCKKAAKQLLRISDMRAKRHKNCFMHFVSSETSI